MFNECRVCNQTKPSSDFFLASKNKNSGARRYVDKICKSCKHEKQTKRRRDFKAWCVEYKGGKCVVCGYNKHQAGMDFHHLDPSKKEFGIGSDKDLISKEQAKVELDKCVLLCKTCHAEVHVGVTVLEP